jgi:hypothetical protein
MSPKRPGKYDLPGTGESRLRQGDLIVILRAAGDLNGRGDAEMLAAVLKGTRSTELRRLGLVDSPVFAAFEATDEEHILKRIMSAVQDGYLQFDHASAENRLVLTPTGRTIANRTLALELLSDFEARLDEGQPVDPSELCFEDRAVIDQLLAHIQDSQDRKYIPLLEAWEPFENKKTRARISQVLESLQH